MKAPPAPIRDEPRPQLRDICPEFDKASRAYEEALRRDDDTSTAEAFSEMQRIAAIFWAGFEFSKSMHDSGIRSWRAVG